jgi:hypothetical protein
MFKRINPINYPKLEVKDILKILEEISIQNIDTSEFTTGEYFVDISKIFESKGAILIRYSASDTYKFCQCVHWFGIGQYFQNKLKINKVLIKLLSNKSLQNNRSFNDLTEGFELYNPPIGKNIKSCEVSKLSPFVFEGDITEVVFNGGYRLHNPYPIEYIKIRSAEFSQQILQNRYNDFRIYKIHDSWSKWFGYRIWNYTYFIFDQVKGEFWILALSSED